MILTTRGEFRVKFLHHQAAVLENKYPAGLNELTDEQLVALGQKGNSDSVLILFYRYKLLINALGRKYYIIGADKEDLIQEAMLGFYKAIRDFDPTQKLSFKNFSVLCVKRQIITAIKTATRQKHIPLNSFTSLDMDINEQPGRNLFQVIKNSESMDPERQVILNEALNQVKSTLQLILSPLEMHSLVLYLRGYTYMQIADEIGVPNKTITNSMYRLQKKLKKISPSFLDILN
ncbi:MAG TPA: RNA polymerase sporulation sigma factor SigH [Desulfotomaculum sp.]|nr:RNA polymerase sporulation sigma factor SigH [Desulfotomaculum sp.]